jgi:xylulokinase
MSAELLMGVDIGTYSSKGVLTSVEGEIVAQHTIEHEMMIPRPGWAEHDPDATWWAEFAAISLALLTKSGRHGRDIAAVGISAIGPCLVPVDEHDRALRAGILYGIDTRASGEIDYLNDLYGSDVLEDFGGSRLTTQAVGPKILWLRRNEPEAYRAARYFHSASDYIVLRLTGRHVMDTYTASLYSPLFDIRQGCWSDRFAAEIASPEQLPEVRWPSEIAGEVQSGASEETGLLPGTPVTVGTVDAVAEAVSVGAIQPGDLMCMYGSTNFFLLASDHIVSQPSMWSVYHALPGLYAVAAGMATTGALTRWFLDELARDLPAGDGGSAYATLAAEAATVPPGSLGLVVLPYFSGERTPINDPSARGMICGLTLAHHRGHVYRAVLESVGYGIAHNLQSMREAGATPTRMVAVGGGTRNPLWLQIVSDISGVPQQVPAQTVGASYGDAFLAGLATGRIPSVEALGQWVTINRTLEPDMRSHELYAEYFQIYQRLYQNTVGEQHALARLATQTPARS